MGEAVHHTHPEWEDSPYAEDEMKLKYHAGTYADLNVYAVPSIDWVGEAWQPCFGFAYQPWYIHDRDAQSAHRLAFDGVTIRMDTLPGGTNELYPMGKNLIHQVGHWLGCKTSVIFQPAKKKN